MITIAFVRSRSGIRESFLSFFIQRRRRPSAFSGSGLGGYFSFGLFRFFREVVAELRKVIWPTRKELLTYATVVIVFVTIMLTIVASLDAAFAWTVLKVFGNAKK